MKALEITIPIKTPNPVNGSHRHWRAAAGIRARQKTAALKLIPRLDAEPVVEVRLTRFCAGHLDGDNLGPALKAVKDAVAFRLRVDDESRLVRWVEDQEIAPPGKSAVRVRVRWLVETRSRAALDRALALPPLESNVLAYSEAPERAEPHPSPLYEGLNRLARDDARNRGGKP